MDRIPDTGKATVAFLADNPTDVDSIGTHTALANSIVHIITSRLPKPFVIGLFGPWGVGKSSIVRMIQRSVRDFEVVVVDAWRKDRDNFIRHFVKKLARSLLKKEEAEEVAKMISIRTSNQRSRWKPTPLATILFWGFMALLITLTGILIHHSQNNQNFPAADFAGLAFAAFAAIFFQWVLPRHSYSTTTTTEEVTLDDPAWFREVYEQNILSRTKSSLICVVIDNLDRVPSEDALKMIKVIKTFIVDRELGTDTGPGVVFLVPCDDIQLATRLENDPGVGNAGEFLRKFFNVTIRIPPVLEQDLFTYVRGLLTETGLALQGDLLDSVTFVITQASGRNPRQPKHFLNRYLARYLLAQQFPDCAAVVKQHPDWFAIFIALESEFPEGFYSVQDLLTQAELATDGASSSTRLSRRQVDLLRTLGPIIHQITDDAWHTIHFLKRANVHEQIPGFRELAESAYGLRFSEFQTQLQKVYSDHPYVLSYLWSERSDDTSRMNMANCLLTAIKEIQSVNLPEVISNDIVELIKKEAPGWYSLPSRTSYQRILKGRPTILLHLLKKAADKQLATPGDTAAKEAKRFLLETVKETMQDCKDKGTYKSEIQAVLQAHAASDEGLVCFAVSYPEYPSRAILSRAINIWTPDKDLIDLDRLVTYALALPTDDDQSSKDTIQTLVTSIRTGLQQSRSHSQTLSPRLFEACRRLVKRLASLDNPPSVNIGELLTEFYEQGNSSQQRSPEVIYNILACLIEAQALHGKGMSAESSTAHAVNLGSKFLTASEEALVLRVLQEFPEFVSKRLSDKIPEIASRTGAICGMSIMLWPPHRAATVTKTIAVSPSPLVVWLSKEGAKLDSALRNELVADLLSGPPKPETYAALGYVYDPSSDGSRERMAKHFDGLLLQAGALSVVSNLEGVLRKMKAARYHPTNEQRDSIREGKDSIDMKSLTDDQRMLIREFLQEGQAS